MEGKEEKDVKQAYREFTAVVLAGGEGTRLNPLTAPYTNGKDARGPVKALLPLANHAMLSYPLRWLARNGYPKPLIVTTESCKKEIEAWCAEECPGFSCTPSIHVVPDDTDTAQAVAHVAPKIDMNALIISCDTVTDFQLSNLLMLHRREAATATIVFKHSTRTNDPKSRERHPPEYVGLEDGGNRITFFASSSELSDPVPLKKAFLTRRPNITMTTALMDGHVYVLSKWALDLLVARKQFTSLKHELLPTIVAQQFRRMAPDGTWGDLKVPPPVHSSPLPPVDSPYPSILCPEDLSVQLHRPPPSSDPVRVFAYIVDNGNKLAKHPQDLKDLKDALSKKVEEGEYLNRVSHISTFLEVCRDLSKGTMPGKTGIESELLLADLQENWVKPSKEGKFAQKASMGAGSLVGKGYQPAESVIVMGSQIGSGVVVGAQTRVAQSIIMNNVTIGANCQIQGCLIGSGCTIPDKTTLKDCVLGFGVDGLKENSRHKGEHYSKDDF